jgi:hypothetical protein
MLRFIIRFNARILRRPSDFLEENGMPMFDSREVRNLRELSNRRFEKIRSCES